MTQEHIDQLTSELTALKAKIEAYTRESFDLKVKTKYAEKRIKLIEEEIEQLTNKNAEA